MPSAELEVTFNEGNQMIWNTGLLWAWIDFEYVYEQVTLSSTGSIGVDGSVGAVTNYIQWLQDRNCTTRWGINNNFYAFISNSRNYDVQFLGTVPFSKFGRCLGHCSQSSTTSPALRFLPAPMPYSTIDQLKGEIPNLPFRFRELPFTLQGWFYWYGFPTTTNVHSIFSCDDPLGIRGMSCWVDSTGHLQGQFVGANAVIYPATNTTVVTTLNQWNHVAMVRTNDSRLVMYLNGVAVAQVTIPLGLVHNDYSLGQPSGSYSTSNWTAFNIGSCINERSGYHASFYCDDISLMSGSQYDSNFTPSTSAFNPLVEGGFGQLQPPIDYNVYQQQITSGTGKVTPISVTARYWRFDGYTPQIGANNYLSLSQLSLQTNPGDMVNQVSKFSATATTLSNSTLYQPQYTPITAWLNGTFDGSLPPPGIATTGTGGFITGPTLSDYFAVLDLGVGNTLTASEFATCMFNSAGQAPTSFTISYSNDNVHWTICCNYANLGNWQIGQVRRFLFNGANPNNEWDQPNNQYWPALPPLS